MAVPESLGPQNRTTWSTFSVKGKNGCMLQAAGRVWNGTN